MSKEETTPTIHDSEDETTTNYKPPKKKTIEEILKADAEDESLRRYKEQLLGSAINQSTVDKEKDPRRVVVETFGVVFPNKEHEDILRPADKPEDVEKLKNTPIVIKEGVDYQFYVKFRIQHDIVSALKFQNSIYKSGIRVEKKNHVMGSYGPSAKSNVWKSQVLQAPSGMLARGTYKVHTKFIDDDGACHLEMDYQLSIKKGWE